MIPAADSSASAATVARSAAAGAGRRGLAPAHQRLGVQAARDRLADERERLAQVERRAQLSDRLLATAHFVARRRGQQPAGECRLARRGARAAQQFEETALAEQVEIVGVGMLGIAESLAAGAAASEVRIESRDGVFVVADRVLARVAPAQHAIVRDDQREEAEHGREQPARIESLRAERDPGEHDAEYEHGEARLRDARGAAGGAAVASARRSARRCWYSARTRASASGPPSVDHGGGVSRTRRARAPSCR